MRSTCAASSACTRRCASLNRANRVSLPVINDVWLCRALSVTWTSTTAAGWRRQGRSSGFTPCCCSRGTECCVCSHTCRRPPGPLASSASARTCHTHRWVPCRIGALRVGACLHRVGAFLVTANYSAGAVESPVLVQSEAAQHCTMEVRTASMLSAGHFPPKLRPEQKRSVVSCQALAGWSTVHVCHGGREMAVGQSSEAGGGRLWRWPTAVGDYQVQRTACAAA